MGGEPVESIKCVVGQYKFTSTKLQKTDLYGLLNIDHKPFGNTFIIFVGELCCLSAQKLLLEF